MALSIVEEDKLTHDVFKNNPVEFQRYVGKYVEVSTVGGERFKGTVYTIDPVSECIVLLGRKNGTTCMDIVMGHAVKLITNIANEVAPTIETAEQLFASKEETITAEMKTLRRHRLRQWLVKNFIPVEEQGDTLRIGDTLVIIPPYGPNNCVCDSDIVLGKVQNLITSMPEADVIVASVSDQGTGDSIISCNTILEPNQCRLDLDECLL